MVAAITLLLLLLPLVESEACSRMSDEARLPGRCETWEKRNITPVNWLIKKSWRSRTIGANFTATCVMWALVAAQNGPEANPIRKEAGIRLYYVA